MSPTGQDLLRAYDEQLRTDAETPSAIRVERLGPLRLVTFAGGEGFVTYRDLGGADQPTIRSWVEQALARYRRDGAWRVEWKTRGHDAPAPVTDLTRPPVVLSTLMPLPAAVRELDASGQELACVVDEFGGFVGVLTVEDLAEELVGELTDEHDAEVTEEIDPEGEDVWSLDGDVPLDELERTVGHPLPEGDVETAAGLVIAALGRLPEERETLRVPLPEDQIPDRALEIEVLQVDRHVPSRLRARLVEQPRTGSTAAGHPRTDAPKEADR